MFSGGVTVGGAGYAATLQLGQNDQLNDYMNVNVLENGALNLNGYTDQIKQLNLTGVAVATGTGTLTLDNGGGTGVTTSASSTSSTISGNLATSLYSTLYDVANGAAANDLVVSAVISSTANSNFVKSGAGTLVLSGANTFTTNGNGNFYDTNNGILVNGGILSISADNNLGNAGNKLIFNGGTVETTASLSTGRTLWVQGGGGTFDTDSGTTLTVTGSINGTGTLTKSDGGTLVLNNPTANQMGPAVINVASGTLLLGAANQINNSTNMTLSGGTFGTGGYRETLGALTLSANSTIDMGSGVSVLKFSSFSSTGGNLTVTNWSGTVGTGGGTDQLLFTSSLSPTDLSHISFSGYGGATEISFGSYYEVAPTTLVPEPSSLLGAGILLGLLAWHRYRQRLRRVTAEYPHSENNLFARH